METPLCDLGIVGLGVMGRNLALNIADHGHSVIGLDKNVRQTQALRQEAGDRRVDATDRPDNFINLLRQPRAIVMLVPAGPPVDGVVGELLPLLSRGDLLIDAGNSHFRDTDRRYRQLADQGIHFFGMGVSGGESGARHGPSLMPGGPREAYERVRPVLEDVAAQVNGEPCVAYLGSGSAGHFVKMVHNGIEYGVMQLIAESYDLLKRALGLTADQQHAVFSEWNRGELSSFLVEITAQVLLKVDSRTGRRLVDVILDVARQKGTGKWTSQDAMDLQVPTPTIDAAVAMRDLSAYDDERLTASRTLGGSTRPFTGEPAAFLAQLRAALYASIVVTYARGLALLRRASTAYEYGLDLETIARIWRGGCIIRAVLLDDIRAAYQARADLPNLLLDQRLGRAVSSRQADLRAVICQAAELGIAAPGLMASLAYFDGYRCARLPANLIQAQRDFFGAHTYERVDEKGAFHTQWT
jgi:6-phosphogluconate dehydrogenase